MHDAILPVAFPASAAREIEGPASRRFVIGVLPLEDSFVWPGKRTRAVTFVIFELTHINSFVHVHASAKSLSHTMDEFTAVGFTIFVSDLDKAVRLPVNPGAFAGCLTRRFGKTVAVGPAPRIGSLVVAAVRKDETTIAVHFVIQPFPFEEVAVRNQVKPKSFSDGMLRIFSLSGLAHIDRAIIISNFLN
jgi:hypothetical protein